MKRPPLTQEEKDNIVALINKGIKFTDVARIANVSITMVYRLNPKRGTYSDPDPRIPEIIHARKQGLTQREISKMFKINQSTVHRILKREGISMAVPRKIIHHKPVPSNASVSASNRGKVRHIIPNAKIKELWLDGWTKTRIAKHLDMSFNTVSKAIIAMGIEDMQEEPKLETIHPTEGKVKVTVPGIKGEFHVRPDRLDKFKIKYNLL